MSLSTTVVPKDSIVRKWVEYLRITEVPIAYQITTALALIGMVLKRNAWCDQIEWKVYPNLSVLLVGPSGIGKDVGIRSITKVIDIVDPALEVGGKTMEAIVEQLLEKGELAAAYIPAPELTAFIGGKDYQKSMVQELTDLLSTGDKVNVSLKSAPGVKRIVQCPTISMVAGSTAEWLHKAMPDGSLDGGLFPRFLIVCEEYGSKHIPFPKFSIDATTRLEAIAARDQFIVALREIKERFERHPREIVPVPAAVEYYENWYANRFTYFTPVVKAYANRSRDQMLRLGMLSAISRGNAYIEVVDFIFAKEIIKYVAASIEKAAVPPSQEAKVARHILDLLPADVPSILRALHSKYAKKDVLSAIQALISSELIVASPTDKRQFVVKEVSADDA